MRRKIIIASAAMLALGVLGLALFGNVSAQPALRTDASQQAKPQESDCHDGDTGDDTVWGAVAKALDMSESALSAELDAGKNLKEFAKARGLDEQRLTSVINGAIENDLNRSVQDGSLTSAQAERTLEHLKQAGADHVIAMVSGQASENMMEDHGADMMGAEGESCHYDGVEATKSL